MAIEFIVHQSMANRSDDPRQAQLTAAETRLRQALDSGNAPLTQQIRAALVGLAVEEARAEAIRVHTRIEGERALILLQMETLKQFDDAAREELLDLITALLRQREIYRDLALFIGVKGRVVYGAVQTPAGRKTGAAVSRQPHLALFDPPPATTPATTQPVE